MDELTDVDVAARLAERAGTELLRLRGDLAGRPLTEIKDAGDQGAQAVLAAGLADLRPADAVLSEEAADDPRRLTAERVWIIDPLDGTREYSEGRSDWAVHVALWERGGLSAAAVALPAEGAVLRSDPPPTLPTRASGPIRLAVSRSRPPSLATDLADLLGAELVAMGSAGYKIAAVVRGAADVYVHAGGQYQWDSAAPVGVARAAGLHTSRIDGSPLEYNRADTSLPDLVVCRTDLADAVLSGIRQVTERGER
jgi:3'(2'), 5'-bisphosphate nucleotidase